MSIEEQIAEIIRQTEPGEEFAAADVAKTLGVPHDGDGGKFSRALNQAILWLHCHDRITFRAVGRGGRYRRGTWEDSVKNAKRSRRRGLRATQRALLRLPDESSVPEDRRQQVRRLADRYSSVSAHYILEDSRGSAIDAAVVSAPKLGQSRKP